MSIILGLIPAYIARNKGRDFVKWWIYGSLIFIVAIVHSFILGSDLVVCPKCSSKVNKLAVLCRYCGNELSVGGNK